MRGWNASSWFYPQSTGDPGRDRNARTLQFTCLLFAVVIGVGAALDLIAHEWEAIPTLTMAAIGFLAAAVLNRTGRAVWAARTVLFVFLVMAITLVFEARDGFRSLAMLLFPALLLISVMLLDRISYLRAAGTILVAVTILGVAEKDGLTRAIPGMRSLTSYQSIFYVDLFMLAFAVVGSRISRDAQSNVFELRTSIDRLSEVNLELRQTGRALRESEERFRATFFRAAVGIAQTDLDGHLIVVNDQFREMLGYSQAELTGKTFKEVTHPDDREASVAARRQLLSGEISSWSTQKRYIRKDGSIIWGQINNSLVRNQNDEPKYFITVVEDITDKIRAEQALRASEERLALAQNAAQLGVWDRDLTTNVITICGHYAELHGLSPGRETITREEWFSLVHPDDRERVDALRREAREGTHTFDAEFRVIWPEGSTHWLHAKGVVTTSDLVPPGRSMGVLWDITERKLAEAKLRESEERFRRVFEEGPLGVALVATDFRFLRVNAALCQLVGYREEELLQKTFADITHPDDLQADVELAERLFRGEIPVYRLQKRYLKKTGEVVWFNLTASVIRHTDGDPVYGLAMIEDITEAKRNQEEAFARQKLETVGTLANGIAHDFNNILGAVLAQAEVAMADLTPESPPCEQLKAICEVALRGSEIVRELMIYAGKEYDAPGLVSLSETVEEMFALLSVSVSKHAKLKTDLDKQLPPLQADASQISRLVMNLVTNASEAIGDRDGTIHLSTRHLRVSESSPQSAHLPMGEYLQLEVSDTGCGMSPETKARVFDPFFSTKSAGRGLGMAVVHGIVRRLGGEIQLASEQGQGTTVQVLLPYAETGSTLAFVPTFHAGEPTRLGHATTVMLVEDEDPLRRAVSKMLAKRGFSVIEARDGSAALDELRAKYNPIDVLFLDITLPGTPSRDVLTEARRLRPEMKVIATSAYNKETTAASLQGTTERFIRKPYQLSDLVNLINDVVS